MASAAVLAAVITGIPETGPTAARSASAAEGDGDGTANSENAARAEAAASGKRVEALNLRTERSETLANPDGTFTRREHVQPVRAFRDGKWVGLDSTLVQQADGSWTPRASTVAMTVSGGGEGPFASLERAGKTMSVSWPGTLPKPIVEGSTAKFVDVLPGVDLTVTAEDDGFSHLLVVKTPEGASNPELATIELPVETDGVRLETGTEGGVVAVDEGSNGPVFEAPQPQMWDSGPAQPVTPVAKSLRATGSEASADAMDDPAADPAEDLTKGPGEGSKVSNVKLGLRGNSMTLAPDMDLLRTGTLPLYIDPVSKTYTRSGWTMVSSYYPSAEFWKFSGNEGVGMCPKNVSALCASSGDPSKDDLKRQFYALPTSGLAGKDIISAEFTITLADAYNATARSVVLSRVNSGSGSAISSSTNWGNQPTVKKTITSASTSARAGSCTSNNQNLRFNVKSAAQEAAEKSWATTTFRLAASDESSYANWNRFCGNGQLEVTYNRPPSQPSLSTMSTSPGGKCAVGSTRPYTYIVPEMRAAIRDSDHNDLGGNAETLQAQFYVSWTVPGTTTVVHKSFVTDTKTTYSDPENNQVGIATFKVKVGISGTAKSPVPYTIPENTVISWQVRGSDGQSWGAWSVAPPAACQFIYDKTSPVAPTVVSAEYKDDDVWRPGVGDYGTFTFTTPSTDVVSYLYEFHNGTSGKVSAGTGTGRPGKLRWTPPAAGAYTLTVTAVDASGRSQVTPEGYTFMVDKGRSPAAAWKLDEPSSATEAAGRPGDPLASKGPSAVFGTTHPGEQSTRSGVALNGTSGAYLATAEPIVDTAKTFSVAAWVYLPELPTHDMSIVSQDGTAEPGFSLGYDSRTKRWVFRSPDSGMDAFGDSRVLDSGVAAVKQWTHLVGVYDAEKQTMQMYKQGLAVASAPVPRRTTWNATGGLQMGRSLSLAGYTDQLKGTLSEVQIYDRLLTPAELGTVIGVAPTRLGAWPLDEMSEGVSPDVEGGTGLSVSGSASIFQVSDSVCDELDPTCTTIPKQPLNGDGHLELDGTTGYATREAGLFADSGSFAVTVRARIATAAPGRDETALSLSGPNGAAAVVKYSKALDRWQLVVTDKDAPAGGATVTSVHDTMAVPTSENSGNHLVLAYDAVFGTVRLYVDGQLAGAETLWPNAWDFSTVSIQVGRSLTGATGSDYFSGALDDVRAFQGVVNESMAAGLRSTDPTA